MGCTMATALLQFMFVPAEVLHVYPEITFYYKQWLFAQRTSSSQSSSLSSSTYWVITSFFSKEVGKLIV